MPDRGGKKNYMRWLCLMLLFPAIAFAGEDCSMLGGTCKEVCSAQEDAAKGAFLDCSDKQECCIKKEGQSGGDKGDKKVPLEGKQSNDKAGTKR